MRASSYILFSYLSLFIFGLIDNARGPIYPKVIEVFGLSGPQSSWIFTLTSLVSFAMTMGIPYWLPRFGAIKASKAAMLFHVAALVSMAAAGLAGQGFWAFLLGSFFLGLAMGIQSVTVNLIVSKVSTPFNSSRLFSGLHSMYGLASLGAPLAMGAVFRFGLSWELAILAIALAPAAHFLYFQKLDSLGLENSGMGEDEAPFSASVLLGVIFSFYVSTEILLSSRMVVYMYEVGEISLEHSSYALTFFFACLLGGRLLFSFFTPKVRGSALLKVSAAGSLVFYLLGLLVHPYFLALAGASMSYFFPFGLDYIKSNFKQAEGIISRVMMFVGAMLAAMHFLFGAVSGMFGLAQAMWIGVAFLCVVIVLLTRLK